MGVFDGNRLNDTTADNPRRTMGEMWVDGEKGSLRLDGDGRLWFKPLHAPEVACDNDRGDLAAYGGGACQALQAHVVKALATGALPENTGRDYLKNLQIQEAVYASHAQGRRIELKDFVPAAEPLIPSL
jgi:predicted dehydrogenase